MKTLQVNLNNINRDEAFRYMGHKGGEIPQSIISIADECEQKLLENISPKYIYKIFDITPSQEGIIVENTPLVFKGRDIAEHLQGCEKCVLMCATLSSGADRVIRQYEASGMEKAVVADCLASSAIEQVCNIAEAEIQKAIGDYNYTWRFSAGYGDFPLEIQKDFLTVLDAQRRIGLNITDSLILIPRKSVTAVMGVSKNEIAKGKRGCGCCNMREICNFRKRGTHCGF